MTAFSTFEYQPKLWKLKRPLKTPHGEIAMRSSIMLRSTFQAERMSWGLVRHRPYPDGVKVTRKCWSK